MEITEGRLPGIRIIAPNPLRDERGFFMRTYDRSLFEASGADRIWVQENHSCSLKKGIIRGLHFQLPPFAETKLVRCIRGSVMDVFVDLRKGSSTFGQWESMVLSEENMKMVLIPRGFAHGFCTLEDRSEVLYKVDNVYDKASERGLLWNDPEIGINWPVGSPFLSEKDKQNLRWKQFLEQMGALEIG